MDHSEHSNHVLRQVAVLGLVLVWAQHHLLRPHHLLHWLEHSNPNFCHKLPCWIRNTIHLMDRCLDCNNSCCKFLHWMCPTNSVYIRNPPWSHVEVEEPESSFDVGC